MSATTVAPHRAEIRVRGKRRIVPAVSLEGRLIVSLGRWLRIASVHDEIWMEEEAVKDPQGVVATLRACRFEADLFTFGQQFPDTTPRHSCFLEWDNVAAISLGSHAQWWEGLPQETRKNTRKAAKQGVEVRLATPDEAFIRGVVAIYNETPVRQGKPFSKFGLDYAAVQAELLQLAERSDFVGAYLQGELVGFIKVVYMGKVASILSIVPKVKHADKKVTNALIAKTVEIACSRGMSHLLYGKYVYGNKASSPLTEFKRRNGFEQVQVPRYYIPLTLKGAVLLKLKLHRGLIGILPDRVVERLIQWRAHFFQLVQRARKSRPAAA